MKKNATLYNMLFPIWLLWLFPMLLLVVLPANYIIDFTVIAVTLHLLRVDQVIKKTKSIIVRTWLFGFAADVIGTGLMLLSDPLLPYPISSAVAYSPFDNMYAVLWIAICVVLTALFIYMFNYKICLRDCDITVAQKKKLALSLAIFTAPYLFFLPTNWFYNVSY